MTSDADEVPSHRQKMEEVVRRLRADKLGIAHRATARIRQELKSYQPVEEADLLDSVQLNLERSVSTLVSGTVPATEDAENRATTRQRMDVGVPIGDIIRGYRISLTVIYEDFLSLAASAGMTAAQLLEGSHLLWRLGDWFTAGAAAEYRYNAAQSEVRRALERADVVRHLTSGEQWPASLEDRLLDLGLELDHPYRVLLRTHGDPTPSKPSHQTVMSHPGIVLSAEVDGRTIMVWPARLAVEKNSVPEGQCWAAGPPRELRRLHESASVAERILSALPDTASGPYSAADLGWRLTLPLDPLVHGVLSETYLGPLQPDTPGGAEITQTLVQYLNQGRSVRRTAEAMTVHQNTVRYRLDRFERLTGTSLDDTNVLVDLAMVLAHRPHSRRDHR